MHLLQVTLGQVAADCTTMAPNNLGRRGMVEWWNCDGLRIRDPMGSTDFVSETAWEGLERIFGDAKYFGKIDSVQ